MPESKNPIISATPKAAARLQKMAAQRGPEIGVRLRIVEKGCAGKAYQLDFVDKKDIHPEDILCPISENLTLCIDPESLAFARGTEIDYLKKGLTSSFVFHNPNEKTSCGCGESFYV